MSGKCSKNVHFWMSFGYGIHDNFQTYSGHTILSGISAQKVQMIYAIICTVITIFKLYIINNIFTCSSSLLNMSRKVLNVSLLFLHFFIKLIYPFLEILSRIFSCPENVQFDLSEMRLEFFYVQNMSGLHVQYKFQIYSNISGQIPDISMTFSGHSFFIGIDNH